MIKDHSVDLIVVGANKLDARKIKDVFKEIAEQAKLTTDDDDDYQRRGSKTKYVNEALVIWGCLEVPKLFASSHKSMKLLKNCS